MGENAACVLPRDKGSRLQSLTSLSWEGLNRQRLFSTIQVNMIVSLLTSIHIYYIEFQTV